jgi:hypothetical protein
MLNGAILRRSLSRVPDVHVDKLLFVLLVDHHSNDQKQSKKQQASKSPNGSLAIR